ncbi:MAG: hypothetical protein JNM62_01680 [Flavobacteriales bacterium]|nr:hypothetical protein [Flavobacteriales bacterium]
MEYGPIQRVLKVERPLATAAHGYFVAGMTEFHRVRGNLFLPFQVSLGTLSISVELMLKALIARKAFVFLYDSLPMDLQIKLLYPRTGAPIQLNRVEQLGLTHFSFKASELDRCIGVFYALFPEHKQKFKSGFDLLAVNRNNAVHAVIQGFQRYDLERVAYLSVNLFRILKGEKVDVFSYQDLTKADESFLTSYNSERVERVKKAMTQARERSKGVEGESFILTAGTDWHTMPQYCPICNCECLAVGYTSMEWDHEDGDDRLTFYCEEFTCESCGLELKDSTELELAGMLSVVERDSDVSKWIDEFGEPEPPFLHEKD